MQLLVPAALAALVATVTLTVPAVPAVPAVTAVRPDGAKTTPASAGSAAAHAGRVSPREGFAWPLSPRPAVFRRFEQPQNQWSRGHRGLDLLAAVGQPVLSAGDGVVAFSGRIAGRGVIVVRHAGGLRTTYDAVDERLASGAAVHLGDLIGVVSPVPGHCAPLTCLHWGAIADRADQQSYRDPLSLLGLGRPILLPLG